MILNVFPNHIFMIGILHYLYGVNPKARAEQYLYIILLFNPSSNDGNVVGLNSAGLSNHIWHI